jgi:hypothetical protein
MDYNTPYHQQQRLPYGVKDRGFAYDILFIAFVLFALLAFGMDALMDIPPSWVEEAQAGDV